MRNLPSALPNIAEKLLQKAFRSLSFPWKALSFYVVTRIFGVNQHHNHRQTRVVHGGWDSAK